MADGKIEKIGYGWRGRHIAYGLILPFEDNGKLLYNQVEGLFNLIIPEAEKLATNSGKHFISQRDVKDAMGVWGISIEVKTHTKYSYGGSPETLRRKVYPQLKILKRGEQTGVPFIKSPLPKSTVIFLSNLWHSLEVELAIRAEKIAGSEHRDEITGDNLRKAMKEFLSPNKGA